MADEIIELRDVEALKPHPLNHHIYAPPSGPDFDELVKSMREGQQLENLHILPDGTILSGHRRCEAAKLIGMKQLRCIVHAEALDALAVEKMLIEFNRYRHKTYTELMNEGIHLERIEAESAKLRQGQRADLGLVVDSDTGRTRDKVGASIGVSGVTYRKMKAIFNAKDESPLIADKIAKLDAGETSVDAVFKLVNELHRPQSDFNPKVYDMWAFAGLNPKYGKPHPGCLPGDMLENIVHYFTEEGDVVADPFSGGGITLDVCKAMGRMCYASDLVPTRPDIFQWDIAKGFPPYEHAPHLIFLDPPYWNMVAEDYAPESASSLDFVDFIKFLIKLSNDVATAVRPGGVVAAIIMKQKFRLPPGLPFVDWPFIWYQKLCNAGLIPMDRIACPWPTSIWQAFHVEKAKEERRILPLVGDLLILTKPLPSEEGGKVYAEGDDSNQP